MLQLVREIPIRTVVKTSLSRRGFLFYVAAGFSKDLDPESGMTVNLVQVDGWLKDLKQILEADRGVSLLQNHHEFFVLHMQKARQFLSKQAEISGSQLNSLCFREERGWSFSWRKSQEQDLLFSYPFFIEAFSETGDFELLKVKLSWRYQPGREVDFFSEGLKLLKHVSTIQDLIHFSRVQDHQLGMAADLSFLEVMNLTDNYGFIVNLT